MASLTEEIGVNVPAAAAWARLSVFGDAGELFAGVLTDCRLDAADQRTVTFANGMVVREQLIGVEPARRRIAYAVQGAFAHHNAAMEVTPDGAGARVVWHTDVLPHEAAAQVTPLMQAGLQALKRALER